MELPLSKLEHALAREVLEKQQLKHELKELQRFIVQTSELTSAEAKSVALAAKAREIKKDASVAKGSVEELERHAIEDWAEELGLGPSELRVLPDELARGPHLFLEPDAVTPTKHDNKAEKKELIPGHA